MKGPPEEWKLDYGQFCPIAKATEMLGEKWTLLILRELLMGGTRFSELQRGLPLISPAILSKRLKSLEECGLLYRRRISGLRGYEYLVTESARELQPILMAIGNWGMRWARTQLSDSDYDAGMLMLYLQRSIRPERLPGGDVTIRFHFEDLEEAPTWWLLVRERGVEVCTVDPCVDVDVYFTTTVRKMTEVWMGDTTYRKAIRADELKVTGPRALTRDVSSWLESCPFSADAAEAAGLLPRAELGGS
jgi:DNA-binding HxlR family transcriptional regulator